MSSQNEEENKPETPIKKDPFMYIPLGDQLKSLAPVNNNSDMTLYKALNDEKNSRAKFILKVTTYFMVFFPLLTFFGTSLFVFPTVSNGGTYTDNDNLTYSGIASVVAVNIVVICYMIYALCIDPDRDTYDEDEDPAREEKQDQNNEDVTESPKKKKIKKTKKNKKTD